MAWTDEQIEFVKANWNAWSASVIADRLGVSRNAVIGKAHRLGLLAKKKPRSVKVAKKEPMIKIKPHRRLAGPLPDEVVSANFVQNEAATIAPVCDGEPVEFLQLKDHHCRAPLDRCGSDGLMLSCGAFREAGSSYCPEHTRRFFTSRGLQERAHGKVR